MTILVRRTGALGDVVLTTAIIRRLKRENPSEDIVVQTAYPDVFRGNPHVTGVVTPSLRTPPAPLWRVIDLDMAYERRPNMHIVEAYMREAFWEDDSVHAHTWTQELFFDRKPLWSFQDRPPVAVHAAVAGWRNRTLPRETWIEVVTRLRQEGMWPILVGTERDMLDTPATKCSVPDIHAQARMINSCACFVGSDSGLLHVAGATNTPIVGVFTCADPPLRMPVQRGNFDIVLPRGLDCIGCLHRQTAPTTVESCERGDIACVSMVHADDIVQAVTRMVESKRPG